jgi:hypothetical protein
MEARTSVKSTIWQAQIQPGTEGPPEPLQAGCGICTRRGKVTTGVRRAGCRDDHERLQHRPVRLVHPPVIHKIEQEERRIRIWASDNVRVTSVQVTLLDEEGNAVEKGDWWEHVPSAVGKVVADARDPAGNVVKAETRD